MAATAARTPAPGGGAAAGLAAALGAALAEMGAAFAGLDGVAARAAALRADALRLAAADAEAYAPVLDALRLPRDAPGRAEALRARPRGSWRSTWRRRRRTGACSARGPRSSAPTVAHDRRRWRLDQLAADPPPPSAGARQALSQNASSCSLDARNAACMRTSAPAPASAPAVPVSSRHQAASAWNSGSA